jgi:hypothetical protein
MGPAIRANVSFFPSFRGAHNVVGFAFTAMYSTLHAHTNSEKPMIGLWFTSRRMRKKNSALLLLTRKVRSRANVSSVGERSSAPIPTLDGGGHTLRGASGTVIKKHQVPRIFGRLR